MMSRIQEVCVSLRMSAAKTQKGGLKLENKIKNLMIPLLCFIFLTILLTFSQAQEPQKNQSNQPSYQIGPGDILNIFIWKEPDLTQNITVTPDGKISFPLIGEVLAQGKTVTELKEIITKKLENFITAPEVTVIVQNSLSQRIYMLGKVNQPGPFPLQPEMTVLQALSTAGGLAQWADEKNILIIRRHEGKEIQLRFNYKEFISGQNIDQNIILKPNDTIVVP